MSDDDSNNSGSNALAALSDGLADTVDRLGVSVLAVPGRGRGALASAVVWRPGVAVTVAHVFRRAPASIELVGAGGRDVKATAAGLDPATDLAVFRLGDEALPAVPHGDAAAVRAGQLAVLIGRSLQGDPCASFGMINRSGGPWRSWLGGRLDRLIRLDGGVHPGLSGGPVADAAGRGVYGIASAALSRHYGIVVPASTVDTAVDALLAGGRVSRGFLGIAAQPVSAGSADAPAQGLLITGLTPDGPAAKAGVLLGDIVLRVADQPAESLQDLRHALADRVGQAVQVALLRGGVPTELSVVVAPWPERAQRC
jgi:S1-C subfamily serine protease